MTEPTPEPTGTEPTETTPPTEGNPDDAPTPGTTEPLEGAGDGQGEVLPASEGDGGPEAQASGDGPPQGQPGAPDLVAQSLEAGYHGSIPSQADGVDDALKAKTVEDAAADQDQSQADFFGVLPQKRSDTAPVPMSEQRTQPSNLVQTEDARVGYVGTLPKGPGPDGEREDLTLAAQAAKAKAQYGDGRPEATTTS